MKECLCIAKAFGSTSSEINCIGRILRRWYAWTGGDMDKVLVYGYICMGQGRTPRILY